MNKLVESVSHLKKKLEKGVGYEKTLHILHKLQKIPISIELLHTTGIGKTIRNLSKQNGDTDIGKTAKLLCLEWKAAVKEEQEVHNEEDSYEEPVVKEEPNFDEPIESSPSFDRIESIIKNEYNRSDDEEVDRSVSSECDRHSYSEKRRHNNEDSKSDKKHKKHKSSHKSRESESTVSSKTEFETLLGLNDQIIKNNKNYKKSNNYLNNTYDKSYVKTETIESINYLPNGLKRESDSKQGIKAIESDILSSLPTAHYRPLPNRDVIDERIEANRKKVLKTNEDLSLNVQSKKGRTAVFAGHARTKTYTHVPRLEDLCIQILMDNYDKLMYLADAPYYLLKPVLQKCNPKQLAKLEKFNPQLIEDSDELWEQFCKKEFKNQEPDDEEDETWRDLYFRCGRERDERLKNITQNISHKQSKALPVRQTQFSEQVKTPREIRLKQERSGMSQPFGGSGPKSGFCGGPSSSNHVKIVPEKPKVAPLMKKALKLQKARYRR